MMLIYFRKEQYRSSFDFCFLMLLLTIFITIVLCVGGFLCAAGNFT